MKSIYNPPYNLRDVYREKYFSIPGRKEVVDKAVFWPIERMMWVQLSVVFHMRERVMLELNKE